MRRGFTSLFGVCSAICWGTGQLVDVTVLSKHCAECLSWQSRAEKHAITAEEYTAWKEGHADTCKINTKQSSPGMVTEGVLKMFQWSEEQRGLVYRGEEGEEETEKDSERTGRAFGGAGRCDICHRRILG